MAVTQRLELRQSQSLVMTPQLQQAIKLLQLSNVDLAAYVEGELEQNPLLERDEGVETSAAEISADGATSLFEGPVESAPSESGPGESGPGESGPGESGPDESDTAESERDTADQTSAETLPNGNDAPLDTNFENDDSGGPAEDWSPDQASMASPGANKGGSFEEGDQSLEQRLSEVVTLRAHLMNQLHVDILDPVDRIIGVHLIDMIDEAGYLVGDLDNLTALLGCDPSHIETTLKKLQRFDPPGIMARSLSECLTLQLQERNRFDPAMAAMLDNLEMVANRDLAALRKVCQVDDEDLVEMIAEIRALDPKPALAFDAKAAEPVIPDILMRALPNGGWFIELNSETLPRVLINERYYASVAGKARSKADKEYITERFQSANWLVKSLHQRATTILKVASEIVRQQDAFFRKGVQHMKPLTLREIAEVIEMHESTVSRVTSNKYIATPRGTYELKYFFSAAIAGTDGGDAHSAASVRHRVKEMINAEDPKSVLSDDAIVDLLRKDGIEIARRTVAKYREAMHIPSSVQRRRQKATQI